MAGIGFELRKLTSTRSFFNLLRANLYSSILSSGAWIISISILVGIYFYLSKILGPTNYSVQFLVIVTYLVSGSLILSSIFQQSGNRYISDSIFEEQTNQITPSLLTSSLALMVLSIVLGYFWVEYLLFDQDLLLKLIVGGCFITLNLVWLFANSLTGLKNYRFILFSYFSAYAVILLLSIFLYPYGLIGLLLAFYVGQVLLLSLFFIFILINYPTEKLFNRKIIDFMKINKALIMGGVFFQLGVWVDKYCFWLVQNTSQPVIGHMRASPIYDMPMFLAFIVMIPGLSVFFYEVEANFSRFFHRYYDAIREGATLNEINEKHSEIVSTARNCFFNVFKVQLIISVLVCLLAPELMHLLGLAPIFIYVFRIDIVSACLLVTLIAQVNILYYLDKKVFVAFVSAVLFILNLLFTLISIDMSATFYGYGFAVSLICSNAMAVVWLNKALKNLTYYSFMSN